LVFNFRGKKELAVSQNMVRAKPADLPAEASAQAGGGASEQSSRPEK